MPIKKNAKTFDTDKWVKDNLEKLVNKFAGEFILMADGQLYRGASPSQLREKAKREHPKAVIFGMRVPSPQDFICALIAR